MLASKCINIKNLACREYQREKLKIYYTLNRKQVVDIITCHIPKKENSNKEKKSKWILREEFPERSNQNTFKGIVRLVQSCVP